MRRLYLAVAAAMTFTAQSAKATCLEFHDDGNNAWWYNGCGDTVGVRWTSDICEGWSCGGYVPSGGRSSINQGQENVRWRECMGMGCYVPPQ